MCLSTSIKRIFCARWSRSSCVCAARSWPSNPSPPSAHTMFARCVPSTFVCNHHYSIPLSLHLCVNVPLPSSLPRRVSSGRSERRCTPAPPAATTWAKTTWWPRTWRFRCCSTSSFPATARADEEVEITFISRKRTYTHISIHSVHPRILSST